MVRGQRDDLLASAIEGRVGGDDERAGLHIDEGRKGVVDLAFGARLQHVELHPLRPRRLLHLSNRALVLLIFVLMSSATTLIWGPAQKPVRAVWASVRRPGS